MTLKEKFNNVEVMFESQTGTLKYDELCEASNQCEQIADDYAIEFGVWLSKEQIHYERYWKKEHYQELLEQFKKEKGL